VGDRHHAHKKKEPASKPEKHGEKTKERAKPPNGMNKRKKKTRRVTQEEK